MKHLKYLFCIALSLSAIPFNSANCSEMVIDNEAAQDTNCPACQEDLGNIEVITLPCNHDIHTECLKNLSKVHIIEYNFTLMQSALEQIRCPFCRTNIPVGVIQALNIPITDSDIWHFLSSDIIDSFSVESLNALKNVIHSFFGREESIAELRAIFSLSEEEARTTKEDLLNFFGQLTINELRGGSYMDRLRATHTFPIVEKATKLLLGTQANGIHQAIENHAHRNSSEFQFAGKYMRALAALAGHYKQTFPILVAQNQQLYARIHAINPLNAIMKALAAAHTGARQEDLRTLINDAEQGTDTWMLSKFYLFTQIWNVMPSSTQQFFRYHLYLKMGGLWIFSSAKIALLCAITTLLVDLVIRAKVGKIDQKRQKEYEDSLLDRDEEEIEEIKLPRRLTPYFSWPIRACALFWTLAVLRVWRAHHMRPL